MSIEQQYQRSMNRQEKRTEEKQNQSPYKLIPSVPAEIKMKILIII